MFFAAVTNIITICVGVGLVWGWVAFISEAISRRTGRAYAVPYPDEVLWARFGRLLLDLGILGASEAGSSGAERTKMEELGKTTAGEGVNVARRV